MKIGVYNAASSDGIGGSESCSAVLAAALSHDHDVDFVHHKPTMELDTLGRIFGVDLGNCRPRFLPKAWEPYPTGKNPFKRFVDAKAWARELSSPYDLFFSFTQDIPDFCHARRGVLCVLFPNHERPLDVMFRGEGAWLSRHVKRLYHLVEWRARMRSWDRKIAISEFTRDWTKRRWGIDCDILHPPGGSLEAPAPAQKSLSILSVGRFTTHGHVKRQLEMMQVFRALATSSNDGWRYSCVGTLTNLPEDRAYFDQVAALANGIDAEVRAAPDRRELERLFATSSIFWHASGYEIDESVQPELVEHYGLSTVEAMAAGCIPIVIDRGGQREIVQHGVNGFLWNTLAELRKFTELLIRDDALRERMSRAAFARSRDLSREAFIDRARAMIGPPWR